MILNFCLKLDELFGYNEVTINEILNRKGSNNDFRLDDTLYIYIYIYIYVRDTILSRKYFSLKINDKKDKINCSMKIIKHNPLLLKGMQKLFENKLAAVDVELIEILINESSKDENGKKFVRELIIDIDNNVNNFF